MKILSTMCLLLATGLWAPAQVTNATITLTPNAVIADNNANGLLVAPFNVSGLAGTSDTCPICQREKLHRFDGDLVVRPLLNHQTARHQGFADGFAQPRYGQ